MTALAFAGYGGVVMAGSTHAGAMRQWLVVVGLALLASLGGQARAQATYRIENGWLTDRAINVEHGGVEASPAGPGFLSAQWEVIPFADSGEWAVTLSPVKPDVGLMGGSSATSGPVSIWR